MRVGLVCPYSLDAHGGVQNHVRGLAEALQHLGHQVAVLAPGEPGDHLPAHVTATGKALAVPYNGSVARVGFGPLVARRVRRWLDRSDLDVLHIHEPATPSVSVLALWAATGPVVATYHTAQERSRALELSAATLLRPGLAKIDAHVAVSEAAGRTLRRYRDVEPEVIPNGVPTRLFAAPGRSGSGPSGAGPVVVFVGRVDEPRKGFAVLVEAWPAILRRHPRARLVVVGAGDADALATLPPGLRRRVELRGAVDDGAKAAALAAADLVVAPNTYGESFGIVLVEAMAAGRAVLASDLPAFRRVLGDGRLGALFRTGDAEQLAARAAALLDDPDARRRLGLRARRAASAYDWSRVAPRVVEVYEATVRGGRQAAAG